MFKRVAYDITSTTAKLSYFEQHEKRLLEQELTLSDTHELNEGNITNLNSEDFEEKRSRVKVHYQSTLLTKYIKISEFLLGKIPASKSIQTIKSSVENNNVYFKYFKDNSGLSNPVLYSILCNIESHKMISFDTNQQSIENILAKKEKNDTMESSTCGVIKNTVGLGFKEGRMHEDKQYIGDSQERQQLQESDILKVQVKELSNSIADVSIHKEKNQLDDNVVGIKNQNLSAKRKKSITESYEQSSENKQVDALKITVRKLKNENEEFKIKKAQGKKERWAKLHEFEGIQQTNLITSQRERFVEFDDKMIANSTEEKSKLGEVLGVSLRCFNEKDKKIEKAKAKFLKIDGKSCDNIHVLNQKTDEKVKSQNESLIHNKDNKNSKFMHRELKIKSSALAFLVLFIVCAACASFTAHCLAMRSAFAVAASVFLALECYCLYKTNNTTPLLDDVQVSQISDCALLAK